MCRDLSWPFDPPEPAQRLAENLGLVTELRFVRNVLIVTAAANAVMRASRRRALRRGFEDAFNSRADEFLFLLDRLRRNALRWNDERHEDRRSVVMREAFAAVHEFFDCDFHFAPNFAKPRNFGD